MMIDDRGREEAALLHEQAVRLADTEQALADVLGQVPTVPVRAASVEPRRRRWQFVTAAAALVVAVVAGVAVAAYQRDGSPAHGPNGTIEQPSTVTASPTSSSISTPNPSSTPTTPTSQSTAASVVVTDPDADWTAVAERDGVAWESAGIPLTCAEVWWTQQQMNQIRCTQIQIDPSGVPVTFEPSTRAVTRHARVGGAVSFVLPAEYVDPTLIAAGPDDVAYFSLDNPWPQSADVLAVSVSADDAGTVLQRYPQVMGIGDADLYSTAEGMVLTDWYAQGPRPQPDDQPFVEWLRRSTGDGTSAVMTAALDDTANTVRIGERAWWLGDRLVAPAGPGSHEALATFDGGFIVWYRANPGDGPNTEVMRGYPDGSVEHWLLPAVVPVLEPNGTMLLPDGDHLARLAPFAAPANGWDGQLEIDPATGTAQAVGLDQFLDALATVLDAESPWAKPSAAFADAVAGPTTSPAELRTIREVERDPTTYAAAVITERLLDDSVYGIQLVIHLDLSGGTPRVQRIDWTNACQPGRGHQEYTSDLCT